MEINITCDKCSKVFHCMGSVRSSLRLVETAKGTQFECTSCRDGEESPSADPNVINIPSIRSTRPTYQDRNAAPVSRPSDKQRNYANMLVSRIGLSDINIAVRQLFPNQTADTLTKREFSRLIDRLKARIERQRR